MRILSPAGHIARRILRRFTLDESQAHLAANRRFAASVNLSHVTARVSHCRSYCLLILHDCNIERHARTPPSTFLFLPIQLSNSQDFNRRRKKIALRPTLLSSRGRTQPGSQRQKKAAAASSGSAAADDPVI